MNTLVIIPVRNPKSTLVSHVESLICECAQVIIVNDASYAKYNGIFEELSRLPGVTVIDHAFRQGRNASLRTAFAYYDAHLLPIRVMDLSTEIRDEYYQTSHVLRSIRIRANAAGEHLRDSLIAIEDAAMQIPFMRTAR